MGGQGEGFHKKIRGDRVKVSDPQFDTRLFYQPVNDVGMYELYGILDCWYVYCRCHKGTRSEISWKITVFTADEFHFPVDNLQTMGKKCRIRRLAL